MAKEYTKKAGEILQNALALSKQNGNPEATEAHILSVMLSDKDCVVLSILNNSGADGEALKTGVNGVIASLSKVSNAGMNVSVSCYEALQRAEKISDEMKDELISVEHLFLGIYDTAKGKIKDLLRSCRVDRNGFLRALKDLRGSQRVTSDNPEDT